MSEQLNADSATSDDWMVESAAIAHFRVNVALRRLRSLQSQLNGVIESLEFTEATLAHSDNSDAL